MNEKFSAPMVVTNGEVKNSASGDKCGLGDSLKLCSKTNDNSKNRDSESDFESKSEIQSVMLCDDPVLKACDSVRNLDNLPANMISKQVDPCEPDSKGSDSLVQDSTDTLTENEVEDDFKLALSPEAPGADSLPEQNLEDSTVQAIKSSSNISEEMEVDEHKEEPKLSEETDSPDLGKESSDIAQLSDVNLGSDINDCAIGEGVACGDSEMIVDKDCASDDACVGNTSNNESHSDVLSSLKEVAEPLKEISVSSEVTPGSPSTVPAREETEDAGRSFNTDNCQESSMSSPTQDEIEDVVPGANTEGYQVSSTSSTAQDKAEDAVQSSNTEGCPEISNNMISSDKKSTNSENDTGPILDDVKNNAEPVLDNVKDNSEPVLDDVKNNANLVLVDVKNTSEPSLGNCESDAERVLDEIENHAEPVLDEPVIHAERVLDRDKKNVEPLLDDQCGKNLEKSSSEKEKVIEEIRESEKSSHVKVQPEEHKLDVQNKVTLGGDPIIVEKVGEGIVSGSDDVSENKSNLDGVVSPNMKTSDCKIDEEITSPTDKIINEGNGKETASPSDRMEDDSHNEGSTLPTSQASNDERVTSTINKIDQSEAQEEDELLVSPNKNTSVSNKSSVSKFLMGMEDEDLLKFPERNKDGEQIVDMEEEAALLSSPVSENKLLEEETESLEDEVLLNSPEHKNMNTDEADIEMKEDDLLNSPKSKTTVEIAENTLNEEKMEDGSTPTPLSGIEVAVSEDTSKIDLESIVDAALNKKEDVAIDESAKTTSPSNQERQPVKSDALKESNLSVEAAVSAQTVEPMEVDDEPCERNIPSKEKGVDSKVEKAELKLELNGTSDCSDSSDVKPTVFSNSSRKDQEGSASMTLSRKRAHSSVADCRVSDEKSKLPRTVNGFDEGLPDAGVSSKKEDEVSTEKKCELKFYILNETFSKITKSDDTEDKKNVPEVTLECETHVKSKDEVEESLLDPVALSYLRKLHKGRVEKLSRNDLEELLVQKLCEAITERSEVGEMRLRCQALERGQEKWKEKYSQLQKQVRELNIVIKKFLSEQASANKDKSTPPTPVRITRSVGLQVALPGSSQRTLAGMRMRAQREAAAAAASSAVSAAVAAASATASSATSSSAASSSAAASSVASAASGNTPINKPANSSSPNVNTAVNSVPIRAVAVAQCTSRRPLETVTKITSPTIQQLPLPQRQVNSSALSNTTVPSVMSTPPRVSAAPQPSLTLTRPQMSSQVQSQIQTTQISGNIRARSNVTMRGPQQTHIVHQVQQRQQAIQPTPHSSVSQVVMSPNSTPQISRLQVVLAPQQQQQLLQQQQIVLRQSQPPNKDVEIIDLDKDDRSRQPTRNAVQQISQVSATPTFPPNGNMTVRLVSNQQSGTPLTSQSHMTLLVPATAQQQKMIITSAPSTVQLNSNQGKSRTNSGVVLKGVVQGMQAQGNAVRQQGVVQQGTIIPSRGLTLVQQPQQAQQQMPQLQQLRPIRMGHPAPLPSAPSVQPDNPNWKMPPPKPSLKIQHTDNGIVLSWNMNLYSSHEDIDTYQLYAYQEGNSPPSSSLWKKVGDVKALPLPMACTLTQFAEGHRYHFAVRAVDIRARIGPFSAPGNIRLEQKAQ